MDEVEVGPAVAAVGGSLTSTELRPTLLKRYSASTLRAYERRWRRYQEWLGAQRYQRGIEHVTGRHLLEWVNAQVTAGEFSPETLQQTCNAVIYYAERAGVVVPDTREAKEQIDRYRQARRADGVPPEWTVPGRRTPRRSRRRREQP